MKNVENSESREYIADQLEGFIQEGLFYMQLGNFKGAVALLSNELMAEYVGFYFERHEIEPSRFSREGDLLEEITKTNRFIIKELDLHTKIIDPMPARPRLIFGDIPWLQEGVSLPNITEEVYHEISLGYVEEWLHGLQHLRGAPIAGYEDPELDVAAYLYLNRIPITFKYLSFHPKSRLRFWQQVIGNVVLYEY